MNKLIDRITRCKRLSDQIKHNKTTEATIKAASVNSMNLIMI